MAKSATKTRFTKAQLSLALLALVVLLSIAGYLIYSNLLVTQPGAGTVTDANSGAKGFTAHTESQQQALDKALSSF